MPEAIVTTIPFFKSIIPEDSEHLELLYFENKNPSSYHFGGVYNSLYPHNIAKITGSKIFSITANFPIGTILKVWLHEDAKQKRVILDAKTSEKLNYPIPEFAINSGQRLTLELIPALNQTVDVNQLAFTWNISHKKSNSTDLKKVNLAIVICTYQNEELVYNNIKKLISSPLWENMPTELIIVNNDGENSTLNFPFERVTQFKQKNSGGSGGFHRGIKEVVYESLADKGFSHILLMDDDVEFHPEIVQRLVNFHQYSLKDNVFGASMLNMEQPNFLHEAGANYPSNDSFRGNSSISSGPIDYDKLSQFGITQQVHYNAWWFCSFSVRSVHKVGLPLKLFIRGDDSEYGLRLRHHGFPTYCLGGLALWHAAFETKTRTWIQYFNFRNNVIRLLTQKGDMQNQPSVAKIQLKKIVRRNIIKNDYGTAAMALRAYDDLIRNDFSWEIPCYQSKITELAQEYASYSTSGKQRVGLSKTRGHRHPKRWIKKPKAWFKYITLNLTTLPIPTLRTHYSCSPRISWWNAPFFSDIVIQSLDKEITYVRNPKVARSLLKRLRRTKSIKEKSVSCLEKKFALLAQDSAELPLQEF